ncbi:MAG: hypothetical protein ACRD3V_25240, partial [Vicinamibacteria bacterium]
MNDFASVRFAADHPLLNQAILAGSFGLFGTTQADVENERIRKLVADFQGKADQARISALTRKLDEEAVAQDRIAKAQAEWNKELQKSIVNLGDVRFKLEALSPLLEVPNLGGSRFPGLTGAVPGIVPGGIAPPQIQQNFEDVLGITGELERAQSEYNQALSVAADLSRIIGGRVGDIVAQSLAAGSALENLTRLGGSGGLLGGFGGAFSAGKGDATGFLGFLVPGKQADTLPAAKRQLIEARSKLVEVRSRIRRERWPLTRDVESAFAGCIIRARQAWW